MKRIATSVLCAVLAPSLLLATQAYAQDKAATSFTPAQKTQIESIVHDYLVAKPEVVVEALQAMQKKQYEQAEQTIKSTQQTVSKYANALFKQSSDPTTGNPAGKVTITEFFDYQCGHCIEMAPVMETMKADPNIRIVFKEFPIRGPLSVYASRAALAANIQGKYYELHHAILTTKDPLTQDSIIAMAKNLGLDTDKLKKDMNGQVVSDELKNNMKLAQDLKLFGTPAFFIGKTDGKGNIYLIPGHMIDAKMQSTVEKVSK
jgi:protein-disulfide isomerase